MKHSHIIRRRNMFASIFDKRKKKDRDDKSAKAQKEFDEKLEQYQRDLTSGKSIVPKKTPAPLSPKSVKSCPYGADNDSCRPRINISVNDSSSGFFSKYPLRSAALLGAIIGCIQGLLISYIYNLGMLSLVVIPGSTLIMAGLFVSIVLLAMAASNLLKDCDEHRFGAYTPRHEFEFTFRNN